MKRLKLLLISVLTLISLNSFVLAPANVMAVDVLNQACNNPNAVERPTICDDNRPGGPNPLFGPEGIATRGIRVFAMIIGAVAVVAIIISGIRFMLTQGDPNSVATARRALIFAIIGLIIAATAQLLVTFVLSKV